MVNDPREEILAVLKAKGPLVPNDLKKVIKGDTMIFGAILSELSSRGMVKISDLKKGSSPFYYLPGQEDKLEQLIEFLNPKDQGTLRFLKEQRVVYDRSLELFQRVSIRKIKDYAKEMTVNTSDGPLLFWRYYLIDENLAMSILRERHNTPKQTEVPVPIPEPQTIKEEVKTETELSKEAEIESIVVEPEKRTETQDIKEEKQVDEMSHPNIRKPKPMSNPVVKEAKQQHLSTSQGLERTPFYDSVWDFFKEQSIEVMEESQIAKDREYEFVIEVGSAIGTIKYYCRARNKKKLSEGDVAPALLKSKQKDLQCLFLTNGEFTKKSLELIKKEYSGLIIKTF